MKNNKIGKIEVKSSKLPKARHNLSRDVHTTFGFGEFQPTFVKEMEPNSSLRVQEETGVLLAPMVAPTMGRLNLEKFGMFVPTRDVLPYYDAYLTGTRFTYGENTFVPRYRPQVPIKYLSHLVLYGARCSLYERTVNNNFSEAWACHDAELTSELLAKIATSQGANTDPYGVHAFNRTFDGQRMQSLNTKMLFGDSFVKSSHIPIYGSTSTPISQLLSCAYSNPGAAQTADSEPMVDISAADYKIQVAFNDGDVEKVACFAFKLSDFGKRIKKIINGVGLKVNFDIQSQYDVTELLATYKAYWDMFGITQWLNWQDTPACKFINKFMSDMCPSTAQSGECIAFFIDLARMWFTDEQDYISAHIANIENDTTRSPIADGIFWDVSSTLGQIGDARDVVNVVNGGELDLSTNEGLNMHAAINRTLHSQLDSELLKKLYLWTNRNSIIGQRVEELLRAQGHEEWLKDHKSNFIGHSVVPLKLLNVVSDADTFDSATDDGAQLGEYGGRGIGYDDDNTFSYSTNEKGYFIVLATVVPKSGYAQGIDESLRRLDRMDEYQPEFDGLGMEASPKSVVVGSSDWNRAPDDEEEEGGSFGSTFGFVPRDTRFKIMPNINNGDFDIPSRLEYYLPFTLDKYIDVRHREFTEVVDTDRSKTYICKTDGADLSTVPNAGVVWRYPTRYGWMSNFYRMFSYRGSRDSRPDYSELYESFYSNPFALELFSFGDDPFLSHIVQNNTYYAGMRPIGESFETKTEGNDGRADMVVSKA